MLEKLGAGVELRRYDAYTVAESHVKNPGSIEAATKVGFPKVYEFIEGKNIVRNWWGKTESVNETLHMAAPIETTIIQEKKQPHTLKEVSIGFVLGSDFESKHHPIPTDKAVRLRHEPGHYLAVASFKGPHPDLKEVELKKDTILSQINKSSRRLITRWSPLGEETKLLEYHDTSLTPSFLRKNEVGIVVDDLDELLARHLSHANEINF